MYLYTCTCVWACFWNIFTWSVYHAQVVHKTGPVLPDLRGGAAEWLHSDFLTAVQFPHGPHHHMHRIKHQRWRELWKGREETREKWTGEKGEGEGRGGGRDGNTVKRDKESGEKMQWGKMCEHRMVNRGGGRENKREKRYE